VRLGVGHRSVVWSLNVQIRHAQLRLCVAGRFSGACVDATESNVPAHGSGVHQ
jgi:hypothetical protein